MAYGGNSDFEEIIGIEGTDLSECYINTLESNNIGTTVKLDGYASLGTHELNTLIVKNGNFGVIANGLINNLSISDSYFQNLFFAAVKLSDSKYVLLDRNNIEGDDSPISVEGFGYGYDLDQIGFADLNGGSVRDCITGISALNSNVFLRRGQTIEHNLNGVIFEDSGTADYALTVGDIGCASIIFNDVGVSGDNIIMNIDAIEHAANNNDPIPKINRFNGNDVLFDICYNHPTLVNDNPTILMKGNYFGGGEYSSISSSFTINYPIGGPPCHYGVSYDDTDFATTNPPLNCELEDYPTPLPFPDKVKCIVEKADVDIMVHEQSRSAHLELVEGDLLEAQSKYQPIADLTSLEANYDPSCLNKIYFARCMALADIGDAFNPLVVLLASEEWEENVVIENTKNTTDYFSIFPNPATDFITIQNKYEAEFEIRIINTYGSEVYKTEFIQQLQLDTKMFEKGIYFVSILDKSLKNSVQKKIVIQ
jgi:hypothetical protein